MSLLAILVPATALAPKEVSIGMILGVFLLFFVFHKRPKSGNDQIPVHSTTTIEDSDDESIPCLSEYGLSDAILIATEDDWPPDMPRPCCDDQDLDFLDEAENADIESGVESSDSGWI
jgi:hypothetical protein